MAVGKGSMNRVAKAAAAKESTPLGAPTANTGSKAKVKPASKVIRAAVKSKVSASPSQEVISAAAIAANKIIEIGDDMPVHYL